MAQISSTKCNGCENGLGKLFCHECKQFLCDSCNTTHAKLAATKNHFVTDANSIDLSLHLVCDEHKLGFAHYCLTCESLTCSSCVTTNHKGHSFTSVADIATKLREEVCKFLVNLKAKHLKLSTLIDKTKSKDIGLIQEDKDKYIKAVNQVSGHCIGVVNSITELKRNRASGYYEVEKQELDYSVATLEKISNEYTKICSKLERLLLQKHDVAFWVSHKLMVNELSELEDIPNIEEPSPIETFDIDDYFDLVLENIQNKYQIRQFKEKREEIRKLTEKLEETERNMGQKDIQIATLTTDNIAELAKLNDTLEQEKAQFIKFKQDHEREIRQLTEKLEEAEHTIRQNKHRIATLTNEKADELAKLNNNLQEEKTKFSKLKKDRESQLKEKTEEIRKLTEKLVEAERNLRQKDMQIANLTRDNIADLAKLNDTLEQEKAQFIKFKQDHEREKVEEIRKLTEKLKEAEESIRQNEHRIATLTREKVDELANLNNTLQEEKTKFTKLKKDQESTFKEKEEKLKTTAEKAERYTLSFQEEMKQNIERSKQLENDKEQLEKDFAKKEKNNADTKEILKKENSYVSFGNEQGVETLDDEIELLVKSLRSSGPGDPSHVPGVTQEKKEEKIKIQPNKSEIYATTEGITVKVYNGNILKLDVDCIVNAADESLLHGGGIAAVISGAAGYQFDQECDDYIKRNGRLSVGECCSTSAGKLNYKNILHTVIPRWGDYKYDEKKKCASDLKKAIISSFEKAEHLNLKSIAIPLSAGIFGVPKEVCVAEYSNAVIELSQSRKSATCLKEIHFVDKDFGLVSFIQNEFNKIFLPSAQTNSGLPAKGSERHNFQRSVSSGSGNNSFQQGSSLGGNRSINHTAQFVVKSSLKIYVKIGNITKCEVDAIACPQDELKIQKGAIAREVEKIGGSDYITQFDRLFLTQYGSIMMPAPINCPWKYIIQTVPPRWNLEATRNKQVFERNLKETVSNILNEAKYGNIKTVAIPLMGIAEKGYDTPVKTFAEQFMKAIFQQFDTRNFTVKEIHIVVHDIATVTTIIDVFSSMENQGVKRLGPPVRRQSEGQGEEPMEVDVYGKEKENCCICLDKLMKPKKLACGHTFCTECIEQHFKFKPSCPQCGAIHGTITGTQPKGKMTKRTKNYSLPGFHGTDTIEIEYMIYSGVQGEEHPNPGTRFDGITRTAFLPDNRKGRLIARLLEVAFNRRLIFTIGTSTTTGKTGVVTWNDIHHKTNSKPNTQFGYPEEGYLDRVLEELSVKGVTEKDLKD